METPTRLLMRGVRGCPLTAGRARRWGAGVYSLINHGIHAFAIESSTVEQAGANRWDLYCVHRVDSTLAAACHSVFAYQSRVEFLLMRREGPSGGKRSRGAGRRRSERHGDAPRRSQAGAWAPEGQCQPAAHFTRRLKIAAQKLALGSTTLPRTFMANSIEVAKAGLAVV